MNKSAKILRSVAFVIVFLIAAGLFDVFTAWAMSRLDQTAQETVGLVSAPPWATVYPTRKMVKLDPADVFGEARASDGGTAAAPNGD
jgi:hypothetical protein